MGVHCDLILGGVANQALTFRERDIRRGGAVTLVVGDDFNAMILPDTNATEWERLSEKMRGEGREERSSRVGCAEILTTRRMLSCCAHSSTSVVRCPHASGSPCISVPHPRHSSCVDVIVEEGEDIVHLQSGRSDTDISHSDQKYECEGKL